MCRVRLGTLLFAALLLVWSANVSAAPFAYITNQGDDTVSVIDTTTNTVVNVIGGMDNQPYTVVVSPDGSRVYVACRIDGAAQGTVVVIDTGTNTRFFPSVDVGGDPQGIAIHPDGTFVYIGRTTKVSIVDTAANTVVGAVLTTPAQPDTVYGIAVHPNGAFVYAAVPAHDTVYVIDTASNTIIDDVPVGDGPERVVVSPDGAYLYVTNTRGATASDTVSVVSTVTNTEIATIPVGDAPNGIDIHPTGATVYVANSNSDTVSVIDTVSRTVIATIPVGDQPLGISVHPAGTAVYVVNAQDDTVSVIDTASLMVSVTISVGDAPASLGRFITPQEAFVYTCDGFNPPMDTGPVTVQGKNRALPLKARLLKDGVPLTDADVVSSPVIQVLFDSGIGGDPVDVTGDALPAGQGTDGNQFEFTGGTWQFNLKTKNYTAPGTYTIKMVSGDASEYVIAPTCEVTFVVE